MPKPHERSKGSSTAAAVITVLVLLPVLYMVPFIAVFLDEVVLGTRFCAEYLPDWFETAFEIVYWPILVTFFK